MKTRKPKKLERYGRPEWKAGYTLEGQWLDPEPKQSKDGGTYYEGRVLMIGKGVVSFSLPTDLRDQGLRESSHQSCYLPPFRWVRITCTGVAPGTESWDKPKLHFEIEIDENEGDLVCPDVETYNAPYPTDSQPGTVGEEEPPF